MQTNLEMSILNRSDWQRVNYFHSLTANRSQMRSGYCSETHSHCPKVKNLERLTQIPMVKPTR
jgi:hypothetical protein